MFSLTFQLSVLFISEFGLSFCFCSVTSWFHAIGPIGVVVIVEVYLTSHHKQAISPPLIHVDDRRNEREGGGGQKYGERKGRNK